jgi:O-antigen/teichoic acid export membrane protein
MGSSSTETASETQRLAPVEPRRLALNFLLLSLGEFTAKLLTFASFSHMAKVLGPWYYGLLEFTLAVLVFFTVPVDLGLGSYGAREIARNPQNSERLLHEITGLRLLLALCSMLALGILIMTTHRGRDLKLLLMLYGLSLLGGPFLLQWFFQAHDRMQWVALASIVRQAGFATLVYLFCNSRTDVVRIGIFECVSVAGVSAFCMYVTSRKMHIRWAWPEVHIRRLLTHLKEAWPIGLTELAWAFMWYFCTVLLGFIFSDASLGWFGASHRALMALHTFVWLYFFNLLPSISRCIYLPNERLLDLMDSSMRFTAWVGLFAAATLTVVSPLLLTLIYGAAFVDGWHSFSVLVWMLPVAMLSGHHRYILLGYNQQQRLLYCTAAAAVAAIALSFLLVPLYGGVGAAWALLLANIIHFALTYFSVKQLIVRVPVAPQLVAPLLALIVAGAFYLTFEAWHVWFALAVATIIYVLALIYADGRQLMAFLQLIVRPPAVKAEAA